MLIALWIIALISTAAAAYFTYRADRRRAVPYPWLTAGLRGLLLALVWGLLLAPYIRLGRNETIKPLILFLQDESASIPVALKGDTLTYRKDAEDLIRKLSTQYRVVSWGFGSNVRSDSLFRFREGSTDIAAPLMRGAEAFAGQNLGAVILATDGRFNQGSHPLFQNLPLRCPLYAVSIGDTALPRDLRIPRTYAPRTVAKDAQVSVRADLVASRCTGYQGEVSISEGGTTLGSSAVSIPADRFDKSVAFSIKAGAPGLHHYVVSIPAASGETNTSNNRQDVFIEVVASKKNVLIAAAAPHPDVAAVKEALAATDAYTLTTRIGQDIPQDLSPYQVVVLHGLPSADAPQLRGKAVWYIVSSSSGNFTTSAASLSLHAAIQHDAYAVANNTFSAFTPPAGLASVLGRMPPLSAAVGKVSPGPAAQTLLSDKDGAPLWLLQPGASPQALLLGEGIWRWRLYEYRFFRNHNVVDECIRQTVALLAANTSDNPFRVSLPKYSWSDAESISFDAYLLNAANEQINTPEAVLTLKDSSGNKQQFTFERNGSAYRLNVGQLPAGSYTYTATTSFAGKQFASSGSLVVASVPLEAMEAGADFAMLYALSKKWSGGIVRNSQLSSLYDSITHNATIKPVIEHRETSVPLTDWKWFFFLILLVAVADWLLRKYWLAQ